MHDKLLSSKARILDHQLVLNLLQFFIKGRYKQSCPVSVFVREREMAGGGGEGASLEYTPTWVVAFVCSVIVAISFLAERLLHSSGKYLLKKNQGSLFQALQKIKEVKSAFLKAGLIIGSLATRNKRSNPQLTSSPSLPPATSSPLLMTLQGKAPLLSVKALHDLHIFIFVLAVSHVVFSVLTLIFGRLRIRQWRHWEDSILNKQYDPEQAVTHVQDHAFIRNRFSGIGKVSLFGWVNHFRGNPKFNFYKYMTRALEKDFKKVVGISWYLWVFVLLFLLVNVDGWHAYFWISFIPLVLLLTLGTKLEHIIIQLAREVAQKHIAVEGDLVVSPSDDHFWFHRPRLVLILIHIILFQNAFEIAVFFWMFLLNGFDSCIMGEVGYVIPRLVIGVFVQFLCSYSTLPLYAIVAQMGSSFNKAIFKDHVQAGLVGWAQKAKNKDASKGKDSVSDHQGSLLKLEVMQSPPTHNNNGTAPEIKHTT
ncbi:hypothetical protein SASPL_155775 [Salvia splendens]|uniref:MLO-like protein n=1 Tax=Salvia splendens TaxID=180675 RepID=A0A8X8VXS4_SALSN|nr:hypothetical protein SASPL_155775 [Salvia splendens]